MKQTAAAPNTDPTRKSRLIWMDFLRGACILLVIVLHATVIMEQHGLAAPKWVWAFNNIFDPYRMTTLMFLSGMLLQKSIQKPVLPYLWGKFALIYWPFLIWSTITLATTDLWTLKRFLQMPISSPTFLWYLWFLCAYYVLALGLHRLRIPFIAVILLCLIGAEVMPSVLRLDRFCALFIFFLLGHLVGSNPVQVQRRVTLPVALVGLLLGLIGGVMSVAGTVIKYQSELIWAPLGMLTFALWASQFYTPRNFFRPIEWVGRNSLVFYVTHMSIMYVTADLIGLTGATNFWIYFPCAIAVELALATALVHGRDRYEFVKAVFAFPYAPAIVRAARKPAAPEPVRS